MPVKKKGQDKIGDIPESTLFDEELFLGKDPRTISEIISSDIKELEGINITTGELASALEDVYNSAAVSPGIEVEPLPGVVAVFFESPGKIPSPFPGGGEFSRGEVVVTEKSTGRNIIVTALSIHLIREHCFFQGRGTKYRIKPAVAADVLRLI